MIRTIPQLYTERQAGADALVNRARPEIIASATRVIQQNDLTAVAPCISNIEVLRSNLYNLFEGNLDCIKIALENLYMAGIFPALKQRALTETVEQILDLNMANLENRLEDQEQVVSDEGEIRLAVLNTQRVSLQNNDNKTATTVFLNIMYDQHGMDIIATQRSLINHKRVNHQGNSIDHLVAIFENKLFDRSYVTKQIPGQFTYSTLLPNHLPPGVPVTDEAIINTRNGFKRQKFNPDESDYAVKSN